ASGRLEGEIRIELREGDAIGAKLDRALHADPKLLAVVLERIRAPEGAQELDQTPAVAFELKGLLEQRDAAVDLVPRDRQLSGALKARDGVAARLLVLVGAILPREVGGFWSHRRVVVMSEQRRVLVCFDGELLEPARKAGVKSRPSRDRKRAVRD